MTPTEREELRKEMHKEDLQLWNDLKRIIKIFGIITIIALGGMMIYGIILLLTGRLK